MSVENHGQFCCMSLMVSGDVRSASFSPSPTPSHVGKLSRVWVHANTHGMARSDSTPPLGLRLAYSGDLDRRTTEFRAIIQTTSDGLKRRCLKPLHFHCNRRSSHRP